MFNMFNDIFKRWIDTNELNQDDLVPIFLEYDKEFNEGNITSDQIALLLQHPFVQMNIMIAVDTMMHFLGKKKEFQWIEVYSSQGQLIKRFWNN